MRRAGPSLTLLASDDRKSCTVRNSAILFCILLLEWTLTCQANQEQVDKPAFESRYPAMRYPSFTVSVRTAQGVAGLIGRDDEVSVLEVRLIRCTPSAGCRACRVCNGRSTDQLTSIISPLSSPLFTSCSSQAPGRLNLCTALETSSTWNSHSHTQWREVFREPHRER